MNTTASVGAARRHPARPAAALIAVAFATMLGLSSCGSSSSTASDGSVPAPKVVREPLGQASPANAPGQTLYLQEVTIPAHTKLGTHLHEGTQVARVRSGVLTYNIVSGVAVVTHADGKVENFTGPLVITLKPGDAITETEQLTHFGANDGDVPVVITLAALLRDGAPLATPQK
ncbi:MAG: hypothetical protein WCK14_12350 [Actinomycetota bacterium]